MIWLTADLHLGHTNILRYCHRPFHSTAEMDGVLIGNIMESVKPTDTLYILGDFALQRETFTAYRAMLGTACSLVFVKGNHDAKQLDYQLACDFKHNKRHYYCCHYPWQTWRPNTVMLHGHCHGNPIDLPKDTRQHMRFDVGVDTVWGGRKYFPVSIEQVEGRIESARSEHSGHDGVPGSVAT